MRIAFRESGTTVMMIYKVAECTLLSMEGTSAVVKVYRWDKHMRRGSASGSEITTNLNDRASSGATVDRSPTKCLCDSGDALCPFE